MLVVELVSLIQKSEKLPTPFRFVLTILKVYVNDDIGPAGHEKGQSHARADARSFYGVKERKVSHGTGV
jgi:hypothetical protein